ncbi:MAG: DNA topoisomerase IB [Bryobacteraceae bacterium]|nr:DNA topoisomerase IB [Bryobacteraceae bacterium]
MRRKKQPDLPLDPVQSALIAGLRYVRPYGPGIVRKRSGRGFTYIGVDSRPVRDRATLDRIRSLVIPPGWADVWICPLANGHLQAIGRDAKGRKQYRYHPQYREVRDATKFTKMMAFGAALPKIRVQVDQDIRLPGLTKRKVVAAAVKLLDATGMRVGNEEYAKTNESYGLTTLRDHHVEIAGHRLKFQFRGKSGQDQEIELTDRRLAKIVKDCQDIPGYELFQYVDDTGETARLDSGDINDYLREITGEEFTAKDFRTWNGTGLMALELEAVGPCDTVTVRKKNVVASVKSVAAKLGNRPATCRKYYIHPAILDAYEDGSLFEAFNKCPTADPTDEAALRREEQCIMNVIQTFLERAATVARKAA